MTRTQIGRETARFLLEAGAIHVSRQQPFILAAGPASPVYVDVRRLVDEPRLRKGVTDVAVQYAGSNVASAIVDAAGIPCSVRFAGAMRLTLCGVRKRPLGIGRNAQAEGGSVEGLQVLLMDDLATNGGSKLAFASRRSAGAIVAHPHYLPSRRVLKEQVDASRRAA